MLIHSLGWLPRGAVVYQLELQGFSGLRAQGLPSTIRTRLLGCHLLCSFQFFFQQIPADYFSSNSWELWEWHIPVWWRHSVPITFAPLLSGQTSTGEQQGRGFPLFSLSSAGAAARTGGTEASGPTEQMGSNFAASWRSGNRAKGFHVAHLACFYLSVSSAYVLIAAKDVFIFIPAYYHIGRGATYSLQIIFNSQCLGSFITCL